MDNPNNNNHIQPGGTVNALPTYHELSNLEAQPPRPAAAAPTAGVGADAVPDPDTIQPPDAAHLPGYGEVIQSARPPRYEKYKNEPPPGFSGRERQKWQYAHWIVVMTVFLGIGLGVGIYYGVVQARGGNRDEANRFE
ncbi:hypothetical protein ACHAQH_002296 [Verticillium albo-atrum]